MGIGIFAEQDGRYLITDAAGKSMLQGRIEIAVKSLETDYQVVIRALETALQFGMASVSATLHVQNRTIVKHLQGKWPMKKPKLAKLHQEASGLLARFKDIRVRRFIGDIDSTIEAV